MLFWIKGSQDITTSRRDHVVGRSGETSLQNFRLVPVLVQLDGRCKVVVSVWLFCILYIALQWMDRAAVSCADTKFYLFI